jgi:hypothetical protein
MVSPPNISNGVARIGTFITSSTNIHKITGPVNKKEEINNLKETSTNGQ